MTRPLWAVASLAAVVVAACTTAPAAHTTPGAVADSPALAEKNTNSPGISTSPSAGAPTGPPSGEIGPGEASAGVWPTQPVRTAYQCKPNGDWRTDLGAWDGSRYANELLAPAWWDASFQLHACGNDLISRFVIANSLRVGADPIQVEWLPRTPDLVEVHPLLDGNSEAWQRPGIITVTHHVMTVPAGIALWIIEDGRLLMRTNGLSAYETFPVRPGHRYQIAVTASARGYPFFETGDSTGPNGVSISPDGPGVPTYWFRTPTGTDVWLTGGTYAIDVAQGDGRALRAVVPYYSQVPVAIHLAGGEKVLNQNGFPLRVRVDGQAVINVGIDLPEN